MIDNLSLIAKEPGVFCSWFPLKFINFIFIIVHQVTWTSSGYMDNVLLKILLSNPEWKFKSRFYAPHTCTCTGNHTFKCNVISASTHEKLNSKICVWDHNFCIHWVCEARFYDLCCLCSTISWLLTKRISQITCT